MNDQLKDEIIYDAVRAAFRGALGSRCDVMSAGQGVTVYCHQPKGHQEPHDFYRCVGDLPQCTICPALDKAEPWPSDPSVRVALHTMPGQDSRPSPPIGTPVATPGISQVWPHTSAASAGPAVRFLARRTWRDGTARLADRLARMAAGYFG